MKKATRPIRTTPIPHGDIKYLTKKKKRIIIGKYESSTKIYKCSYKSKRICLKIVNLQKKHKFISKIFNREIILLQSLCSSFLVDIFGYTVISDHKIGIAMEYIDGNDLSFLLRDKKDKKQSISWLEKLLIMEKITKAVHFVHDKGIVHGNIKPTSFLLSKNKKEMKLCGLRMFKIKQLSSNNSTTIDKGGTIRYLANELYEDNSKNTLESDIFSLGMTFYEILSEKRPFEELKELQVGVKISMGQKPIIPKDVPKEFKSLINWCIDSNPKKRPNTSILLGYFDAIKLKLLELQSLQDIDIEKKFFGAENFRVVKKRRKCSKCAKRTHVFSTPCFHYICLLCIVNEMDTFLKYNKVNYIKDVFLNCGVDCFLSMEWIVKTQNKQLLYHLKNIQRRLFMFPCYECNVLNDKRLVNQNTPFFTCKFCSKAKLCTFCLHKYTSKCTNFQCQMSSDKYEILRAFKNHNFFHTFEDKDSPKLISNVRLCPKCHELTYLSAFDFQAGKQKECKKCKHFFCFLCLHGLKGLKSAKKDVDKCIGSPHKFCEIAPLQMRDEKECEELMILENEIEKKKEKEFLKKKKVSPVKKQKQKKEKKKITKKKKKNLCKITITNENKRVIKVVLVTIKKKK